MASNGTIAGDKILNKPNLNKQASVGSFTSCDARIDTMPTGRLVTTSLIEVEQEGLESRGYGVSASRNIETIFPEGNYTGTVNHEGKPNGRGVMRFNDGSVYEGEWKNSVMGGVGTCTYADGLTQYKGEWKNGKPDGGGCFIYSNGDRYNGAWKDGQMEGRGLYSFQNSEKYDGGWKLNRHHGDGKFTYESGNIYDGQWRHGKKEGNGIFKYANGDEFAGEYSDDRKDGLGVYRRANGELDIKSYSDDIASEGVRFSADRKKAWNVKSDGTCCLTLMKNAETFRENASIISPFLAHYLDNHN